MPATAGRVRMPANNRVHSSAALQTHGIWQSAIGYDPYAPEKASKSDVAERAEGEGRAENAYASFQGLLALARITGSSANDTRGACKKCGRVGHLTYQCRNFLSAKEDKETDDVARQNAAAVAFDKIKRANGLGKVAEEESSSEEEESESSDSDVDPELERIIAARMGKNKKAGKDGKVNRSNHSSDDDDEVRRVDRKRREKKRSRKHRSSEEKKKKKPHRRDESSDDDSSEEEERRRRHRKSKKEKRRRHRERESSEDKSEDSADRHRRHGKRKKGLSDGEDDGSAKRSKHSDRRSKSNRYRE